MHSSSFSRKINEHGKKSFLTSTPGCGTLPSGRVDSHKREDETAGREGSAISNAEPERQREVSGSVRPGPDAAASSPELRTGKGKTDCT
jgi:hypothetical protein